MLPNRPTPRPALSTLLSVDEAGRLRIAGDSGVVVGVASLRDVTPPVQPPGIRCTHGYLVSTRA